MTCGIAAPRAAQVLDNQRLTKLQLMPVPASMPILRPKREKKSAKKIKKSFQNQLTFK